MIDTDRRAEAAKALEPPRVDMGQPGEQWDDGQPLDVQPSLKGGGVAVMFAHDQLLRAQRGGHFDG